MKPPISRQDQPTLFAGTDRVLEIHFPASLGAVEAAGLTFVLWAISKTSVITKKNGIAGGDDSQILITTPGVGGVFEVYLPKEDTQGLSGNYLYLQWAYGIDPGGRRFDQIILWGTLPVLDPVQLPFE
jgi:hypothetical protein